MKKLIMGIFGLMLLLPISVNADNNFQTITDAETFDTNATVGTDLDNAIYSVSISWDSLEFNYKIIDGIYKWYPKEKTTCKGKTINALEEYTALVTEGYIFYTDNSCTMESNGYAIDTTEYYYLHDPYDDGSTYIQINDYSVNGRVVPSVEWVSSNDYNFVEGKISYEYLYSTECTSLTEGYIEYVKATDKEIFVDSECQDQYYLSADDIVYEEGKYYFNNEIWSYTTLNDKEIPDTGRISRDGDNYFYNLKLRLESKEETQKKPVSGEVIGTITITIRAA